MEWKQMCNWIPKRTLIQIINNKSSTSSRIQWATVFNMNCDHRIMTNQQCDWLIANVFWILFIFQYLRENLKRHWNTAYNATTTMSNNNRQTCCLHTIQRHTYTHTKNALHFRVMLHSAHISYWTFFLNSNKRWSNIQSCWSIVESRRKHTFLRGCATVHNIVRLFKKNSKQTFYRWSPCIQHCLHIFYSCAFALFATRITITIKWAASRGSFYF